MPSLHYRPDVDPTARRVLAVVLTACAVLTLAGFALKAQCIGDYNQARDRLLCSNDIQVLYAGRGMHRHPFPYIHGSLVDGKLRGGAIEYPVLTGLFAWLPALVARNNGSYLQLTALLLAPFSLVTAYLLTTMVRWRALVYALAPSLVWYSFHNWDLLVVCATVAAFHAWWRGATAWAAAWLAIGSCLKLWPGFFIVALLLDRLRAHDHVGLRRAAIVFGAVFGGLNGVFAVINVDGWYAPYAFQALRGADITSNSIWFWGFPQFSTDQLNALIPVLLAVTFSAACGAGWWRGRRTGSYPFIQVSGAMLAAFMLLNKAHSPQYALWLLPFFVLLRLRWGWWVAYLALDSVFYVGLFRWFYRLSMGGDFGIEKQAVIIGVWGRAVMLALLFVVFLRSETSLLPSRPTAPVDRRTISEVAVAG